MATRKYNKYGNILLLTLHVAPTAILGFITQPSSKMMKTRTTTNTLPILGSSIPSWVELERSIGTDVTNAETPVCIDSVFDPKKPQFSKTNPTFFRERHGWCPYSERVWLAFEALDDNLIEYDTIRIDNTGGGRPSYYSGSTPQMKWSMNDGGNWQGESLDLVKEIDIRYNDGKYQSDNPIILDCCNKFRTIFPSRSRPSSRAAFLFQYNGEPLWKSDFEQTLEDTDALLADGDDGPFFGGSTTITIADIAWAPFLERYRYQLPCLHNGLEPYDEIKYPNLYKWYNAMDTLVPGYICRVKGDASSWRKVLSMAGFGNAGVPPNVINNMDELINTKEIQIAIEQCSSKTNLELWKQYASTRPYVAKTPNEEAALIITRNRNAIIKDTMKQQRNNKKGTSTLPSNEKELDIILRELVYVLNHCNDENYNTKEEIENPTIVGALAAFLDERMCVPRDMGCLSAAYIKKIAFELS